MPKQPHFIHSVLSSCAWAGEHESSTETYITTSKDTHFKSVDEDIQVEKLSVQEIAEADLDSILKYFKVSDAGEFNTIEVNNLELNAIYKDGELYAGTADN